MDCKFVERSISDSLGGDLSAQQALELERHLETCADCQKAHSHFQRMVAACRALPDIEARDELWHLIRNRTSGSFQPLNKPYGAEEQATPLVARLQDRLMFYRRMALTAAALAVISIAISAVQLFYQVRSGASVSTTSPMMDPFEMQRVELQYQNAIKSLTQVLDSTKPAWDLRVRSVVEQNLQTIDKAIAECEAALRRDPSNLDAAAYLLAAYGKKVEFLKSVVERPVI